MMDLDHYVGNSAIEMRHIIRQSNGAVPEIP